MTKPIIPRDLKPGDRLWYSKTECATVGWTPQYSNNKPELYGVSSQGTVWLWATLSGGGWAAYEPDGKEADADTPPIIRIERITSASAKPKKAKGDRDAKFLQDYKFSSCFFTRYEIRRLRAIARRLEGGK